MESRERPAERGTARVSAGLSRRAFVEGIGGLGAATFLASCGGQIVQPSPSPRLRRIGYLSGNARASVENLSGPFLQELRKLGYVDGRNVLIEFRIADNANEQLSTMAAELVAMPVDVLVAEAGPAQQVAKTATRTIPIIFVLGQDPVASGLIASLARPGGNVTGVSTLSVALSGKKMELLKETVPGLSRVAVIYNANNTTIVQAYAMQDAARALGLQSEVFGARTGADLDLTLESIANQRFDGVAVTPCLSVVRDYQQVPDLAAKFHLPQIVSDIEIVRAGGLMHLGANYAALYRKMAHIVDRVLKGANPADLPVEQPTEVDFVVNLSMAERLGLTIPPNVMHQVTEVVR
jgi:putative tryptophan/tyrosine transport system substrate-binding protein